MTHLIHFSPCWTLLGLSQGCEACVCSNCWWLFFFLGSCLHTPKHWLIKPKHAAAFRMKAQPLSNHIIFQTKCFCAACQGQPLVGVVQPRLQTLNASCPLPHSVVALTAEPLSEVIDCPDSSYWWREGGSTCWFSLHLSLDHSLQPFSRRLFSLTISPLPAELIDSKTWLGWEKTHDEQWQTLSVAFQFFSFTNQMSQTLKNTQIPPLQQLTLQLCSFWKLVIVGFRLFSVVMLCFFFFLQTCPGEQTSSYEGWNHSF